VIITNIIIFIIIHHLLFRKGKIKKAEAGTLLFFQPLPVTFYFCLLYSTKNYPQYL